MPLNSRRLSDGEYFAAFLKLDEIRRSNPNTQGSSDEAIGRQLNKSARQVCKMREIAKLELGKLNLSEEDVAS